MRYFAARSGSVAQTSAALNSARNALLAAIGLLSTYDFGIEAIQQKYCDQGRSRVVLTRTLPAFFRRISCGWGGKARNASTLPSRNSRIDSDSFPVAVQVTSFTG